MGGLITLCGKVKHLEKICLSGIDISYSEMLCIENYCYKWVLEVPRLPRYVTSLQWLGMFGYGNCKKDMLFALPRDLVKLWGPPG